MQIVIRLSQNNKIKIRVIYKKNEWENLEKLYQQLGLEKYTTRNLFGLGITAEVYRFPNSDVERRVRSLYMQFLVKRFGEISTIIIDDINGPVFDDGLINLALFRIIPVAKKRRYVTEVEVDDGKLMFLPLMKEYAKDYVRLITFLAKYGTFDEETWRNIEIEISVKIRKKKDKKVIEGEVNKQ